MIQGQRVSMQAIKKAHIGEPSGQIEENQAFVNQSVLVCLTPETPATFHGISARATNHYASVDQESCLYRVRRL